jgi:hypothetical protein
VEVTITDDKKEKYMSFEAVSGISRLETMYHFDFNVTAYGQNKEESLKNLREALKAAINELQG